MWPFPKKSDFFQLLADHTGKVEECLRAFVEFVNNPTKENAERVNTLEEEADDMRRILIEALNKSFVTPIDREDIFSLSRSADDAMDYPKSTVEEMTLFDVKSDAYVKKMVEAIYNGSKDVAWAVKNLKLHPGVCAEHLVRAKKAENFVEHRYREALAELFQTNDVILILKKREIYRHLSNAADKVAEAADIIGDILVKIT